MTRTLLVAGALLVVAGLDGMFAGFRASCGRTGLVQHRPADALALRRGLALGVLLLAPVTALAVVDVGAHPDRLETYLTAGQAMLAAYLPYAVLVLLALAAYGTLHWRRRFLASALLLGPLTLVRPFVALVGAAAAWWASRDVTVGILSLAAAAAVVAVEPVAGRRWYSTGR